VSVDVTKGEAQKLFKDAGGLMFNLLHSIGDPLARPRYIIIGRSRDCDVSLVDGSVSGRHLRLAWDGAAIVAEDLGSANGTFVDGEPITRAHVRPGDDVRLGSVSLPWSDPRMRPFLRSGAGGTMVGTPIKGRRFICGSCGARGLLPEEAQSATVKCRACGVRLVLGKRRVQWGRIAVGMSLALITVVGLAWVSSDPTPRQALFAMVRHIGLDTTPTLPTGSPEERSVLIHTAPKVVAALDSDNPITRNQAVQIAAQHDGPFRLEQVAAVWTHVRGRWRYVNDPKGNEYFAKASETIDNGFAGDCDDFAIVLSAMLEAIGGETRVVMMDGPAGGHAYAEVCVPSDAEETAARLQTHYRQTWDRYLGRQSIDDIHFRPSPSCAVWLNLDWNAGVPGGPYGAETWAIAIYPDGHTETLTPAAATGGQIIPSRTASSALPPARP
jgi:hypothetical protein